MSFVLRFMLFVKLFGIETLMSIRTKSLS